MNFLIDPNSADAFLDEIFSKYEELMSMPSDCDHDDPGDCPYTKAGMQVNFIVEKQLRRCVDSDDIVKMAHKSVDIYRDFFETMKPCLELKSFICGASLNTILEIVNTIRRVN